MLPAIGSVAMPISPRAPTPFRVVVRDGRELRYELRVPPHPHASGGGVWPPQKLNVNEK